MATRDTTSATASRKLRIWQQNLNKSQEAQADLINNIQEYDLVVIQEPYIDHLNRTRATSRWRVLYPSRHFHDNSPHTRSVILVNTSLLSENWTQLEIHSADVTAIQLQTEIGEVRIFNIYNPGDGDDESLAAVRSYIDQHPAVDSLGRPILHIWAGDFNRHHPDWELPSNTHLTTSAYIEKAMNLVNLVADYHMEMVLPAGIPTLEALRTRNHTRPDNVFCSLQLLMSLVYCQTAPENRPPRTDHYPIVMEFDVAIPRVVETERRNFRAVDWDKFREDLGGELNALLTKDEIYDTDEVERRLANLNTAVQATIERQVPTLKACPYQKRWWSDELSRMRDRKKHLARKSYQENANREDPIHEEYRRARNDYATALRQAKIEHWVEWLEGTVSEGEDLWKAAKMMGGEASDGGRDRVPDLYDGNTYVCNNAQKSQVFYESFFPPPPTRSHAPSPNGHDYPPQLTFTVITNKRIERVFRRMQLHKATYPGTVPNDVLHHCADLLAPHIGPIYRSTFSLEYYPGDWPVTMTIIARKPGKSDYRQAGAHRPLSISGGWPRGLNACITEEIQHLTETHNLLPGHQFGGRPGRSTIDLLLCLTNEIKAAWRKGQVASILSMDVKGAFPSVDVKMLYHEMRMLGIPEEYVSWLNRRLIDRTTVLAFDDYISEPFHITGGLDQGDPFSLLCYIIYNSGLLRLLRTKEGERGGLFVDDNNVLVVGKDFAETHAKIVDIMTRDHGVLDWAFTHNCEFGFAKFQLTDFSPHSETFEIVTDAGESLVQRRPCMGEPIEIEEDVFIHPKPTLKLVGVLLDSGLKWKEQAALAISRGQSWVSRFRRLSKISRGAAAPAIRRLYEAIAVPRMMYAAEIFLTPQRKSSWKGPNGQVMTGRRESQWMVARLESIQRQAAVLITGALPSTATDTLNIHANLVPMAARIQILRHRAASRLGTLPTTHPLYKMTRWISKRRVKKHRGPMHELIQGFEVNPERIETIEPTRQGPGWAFRGDIDVSMSPEIAIQQEVRDNSEYKIFTDGSGYKDQVAASAVCYRDSTECRSLRYKLGPLRYHEVADGEAVGLILALHIILSLNHVRDITIYLDNQAVAQAVGNRRPKASHYIYDALHRLVSASYRKHEQMRLHIRWIPGHKDVLGNERADKLAKEAASGSVSRTELLPEVLRQSLPRNVVSVRKTFKQQTMGRVRHLWTLSPRYRRLRNVDTDCQRPITYQKLILPLSRMHSSILVQLRTQHVPLNVHLHRIKKIPSPSCPNCGHPSETVQHFLLRCPAYRNARSRLANKLGREAYHLAPLLSKKKCLPALMTFIRETGRLRHVFANIPDIRQNPSTK